MDIKVKYDEQGNKITQVYQDDVLVSNQVETAISVSDITITEEEERILSVGNSIFYLPNYKDDLVQLVINSNANYFSIKELAIIKEYLNENSVVVDIGANIGNHTLYFANECNVKKIYAFEPVPYTYNILAKNIELNKLEDRVKVSCVGISNENTNAAIKTYDTKNLGGTRLKQASDGEIKLVTLDSLNIEEKIDLIKIDVETMDYQVICGAKETIIRNRPVIVIESFDAEFENTKHELEKLGYKLAKNLGNCDYIFVSE